MVEVPGKAGPQGHTGLRGGGALCAADGGIRVTLTQCRQPDAGIYVWVEDWRGGGANGNTPIMQRHAGSGGVLSCGSAV